MGTIHELGNAVRTRRSEMGLVQGQVAALSGLSRQTISQIETGAVPDLGLNKAERLATVLGLTLRVDGARHKRAAVPRIAPLGRAAISADVSYKTPITAARLKKILTSGSLPTSYQPHLHAFLDDAPVSLLAAVAEQLHDETRISREDVWKNYRELAYRAKSRRDIWR